MVYTQILSFPCKLLPSLICFCWKGSSIFDFIVEKDGVISSRKNPHSLIAEAREGNCLSNSSENIYWLILASTQLNIPGCIHQRLSLPDHSDQLLVLYCVSYNTIAY